MVTWYARFIKNLAKLKSPLNDLLKKNVLGAAEGFRYVAPSAYASSSTGATGFELTFHTTNRRTVVRNAEKMDKNQSSRGKWLLWELYSENW